jgi:hypothetical protein
VIRDRFSDRLLGLEGGNTGRPASSGRGEPVLLACVRLKLLEFELDLLDKAARTLGACAQLPGSRHIVMSHKATDYLVQLFLSGDPHKFGVDLCEHFISDRIGRV